jgi:hypothetical protein
MALQHLRSSTANKRPVPGNMSEGQLAMNTASGSPGLFFRDSNSNLVKVGPVHVGTTAPNASPASGGTAGNSVGEQWLDTSSSRYVFKVWDGTAWRTQDGEFVNATGDVMTGALGIIAGSAGSPGLYFSGDTNTGLYSPGADQVAISTNGTGRLFVDASGRVGLGNASPQVPLDISYSSATGYPFQSTNTDTTATAVNGLDLNLSNGSSGAFFYVDSAVSGGSPYNVHVKRGQSAAAICFDSSSGEHARIDSSGRLLVGTISARGIGSGTASLLAVETSGLGVSCIRNTNDGAGGILGLGKSRGTAAGAVTIVQDADILGEIRFAGADGVDVETIGATIIGQVDGTPGANDMPGRLVFSTTADGASSPTEQLRITSDRYVRLASGTGGIQFGGDTAAANALDDYEEGTFTPTIVGTSTAGTATYAANGQVGRYTKIGNRVFFDLFLSWTAHTGTGDLQINGLPFTVQNTTNLNRNYSAILNVVAMTAGNLGAAFSSPNTTAVALRQMPTGGGSVATIPMDTSAQISISGCFEA